jgi:Protein of unknown function (DUF3297)
MTNTLPDRLSINPASPYYNEALLEQGIGVKFKGVEKFSVEEYCISERWIKNAVGKAKDRYGNPLTVKLTGDVEVWVKNPVGEAVENETVTETPAE